MNVVRTLMRPPLAYQHPVFTGNPPDIFGSSVSRRRLERSALVAIVASLLAPVPSPFVGSKQSSAQDASPRAERPMEFVISPDGTRIAYQRSGTGPPLILVHGTADNHTAWDLLVPVL